MSRNHGMPHHDYTLGSGLEFFTCITLVDITKTGIVSPYKDNIPAFLDDADNIIADENSWNKSRNKQRNWETIVQIIGIRAQPIMLEEPVIHKDIPLSEYEFGTAYQDIESNIWTFSFSVEHRGVFDHPERPLGALIDDVQGIPILSGLGETVSFPKNVFDTVEETRNIYFRSGKNINYNYV